MKLRNRQWFWLIGLFVVLVVSACSAPTKPAITLTPISGQIIAGQDITVQATATDSKGVLHVEFSVDNTMISDAKVDAPQKSLTLPLTWKAVAGQHLLSARAFNADNLASDSATLTVMVSDAPAPAPTKVPAPAPTGAPTVAPTNVPGPVPTAVPGPCTNNAAFVADVTVPDGTQWQQNQAFNKIWRVQNSGTCTWNASYQLVFVNGERMTTLNQVPVPPNTAPGQTADLLIAMNAPAQPGVHSGQWQMRDDKGVMFGPVLVVKINTLIPVPPPAAAVTSPGAGYQGSTTAAVRVTFQGIGNTELASVTLFANGVQLAKQTSRTPTRQIVGVFDWRPTVPGNYALTAVAVDNFGQQTTSPQIIGTISVTPPTPQCTTAINFRADSLNINAGGSTTLRWDVDCANAVYLDGQGVNGHDARVVSPGATQTYTLHVIKKDGSADDRRVTITVNQPVPPTAVPPSPSRHVSGSWASTDGKYQLTLQEAFGCPGPDCAVSGELIELTGGAPIIDNVSGNVNWNNGALSFAIERPGAAGFNGTVNASSTQITGNLGTFNKQ